MSQEGRLGKGKYSYLISGPLLPAGRSLHGVLLVAWTQHEQVAGTPLNVEHVDVAVAEKKTCLLPLLVCRGRVCLELFCSIQDRRLVDLLFLQIEQGESVGLPDFDFSDIFREFDVEGWACDYSCWVQATNNTPRRLLPMRKGGAETR